MMLNMVYDTIIALCMCLMLATPSSPKPLSSSRPTVLPVSSTKSDLSTSTEIDTSGSDITTAHTTAGGIQSASYVSAVRTKSRRDIHSIHTNVGIPDNEKLTLQMKLTDARFKASDALTNYGNEPSVIEMRHMATHDFASVIARQIPLLPRLEIMPGDLDQEERLIILERETRQLRAFLEELFELEEAHVTRNGEECGVLTDEYEINYFCDETRHSMNTTLKNAFNEFHRKLNEWISPPSNEARSPRFPLSDANDGAQTVRYNILAGLYQIEQRAVALEVILSKL